MDLSYSPKYEAFRREVRDFLQKNRDRASSGSIAMRLGEKDPQTLDLASGIGDLPPLTVDHLLLAAVGQPPLHDQVLSLKSPAGQAAIVQDGPPLPETFLAGNAFHRHVQLS